MNVNINSMSDPEEEDQNKNTVFPLSSEMIGSLTQQERPQHILNSKQLKKVQRLADDIHTGEVRILIVNSQLVSIGPPTQHTYTNQERAEHVLLLKERKKVQRLADEIQTGELRILIVNGQLVSIDQTRRYIYVNQE